MTRGRDLKQEIVGLGWVDGVCVLMMTVVVVVMRLYCRRSYVRLCGIGASRCLVFRLAVRSEVRTDLPVTPYKEVFRCGRPNSLVSAGWWLQGAVVGGRRP